MSVFFFNDTATTEIYTLSLHDALPICPGDRPVRSPNQPHWNSITTTPYDAPIDSRFMITALSGTRIERNTTDRKSTRLNSSHANISYAVFCLKKKNQDRTGASEPITRY